MAIRSAGILLWRERERAVEVFIGHMGGPFWGRKDAGAWSIPKGELSLGEDELAAAIREFGEEIGAAAPLLDYLKLGEFRQKSGKVVIAFAAESRDEMVFVTSNSFELEWPPHSGQIEEFPEMDGATWHTVSDARTKLVAGQHPILDALEAHLKTQKDVQP